MAEKRILSIGVAKESLTTVSAELEREDYAVETAPTSRSGLTLLQEIPFDLVVLAHPQDDLDVGAFVKDLHSDRSMSKLAKLFIVAADPLHPDLEYLRERAVEIVSSADSLIGDLATRALSGDPRVQVSVIVRLAAVLPYGKSQRICQSENLSISGMLLRTDDTFPIDTRVHTEFTLPGDKHSLRIESRVVRLTVPGEIPGIALNFENLSETTHTRLANYLARQER